VKVGVWDRYWTTVGGGEQYAGAIALALAEHHDVELVTPEPFTTAVLHDRLGLDLGPLAQRAVGTYEAVADERAAVAEASADYDLFVNVSFLGDHPNRALAGWYVAHFPELPVMGRRERLARARRGERAVLRDPSAPTPSRLAFLSGYGTLVANSGFTASWVERRWGRPASVLHPQVPAVPALPKEPLIVAVGRFFSPSSGHCKRQLELVRAFRRLHDEGGAEGWRLVLLGGCDPEHREYLSAVRREAVNLPVEVRPNASGALVRDLLGRASLCWHGAGLGQDVDARPERAEHFGIAVVEAMSAGAVPVVVGVGGPASTVVDGVSGVHVHDLDGFAAATRLLVADPERLARLADGARRRAVDFQQPAFRARVAELLEATPLP
jgi:glycosyltransferase involved in cell wall biosynthesis